MNNFPHSGRYIVVTQKLLDIGALNIGNHWANTIFNIELYFVKIYAQFKFFFLKKKKKRI